MQASFAPKLLRTLWGLADQGVFLGLAKHCMVGVARWGIGGKGWGLEVASGGAAGELPGEPSTSKGGTPMVESPVRDCPMGNPHGGLPYGVF